MLDSITRILENAHKPDSSIRPTELYNEGWMLRIVLDWFANNSSDNNKLKHPFALQRGATWFSEAILPTHFKPRTKSGDKLAETRTHADGVIGHFRIEENTKAGFQLSKDARQFIVIEAKMKSKLSEKTKYIDYWDQVSRNVACMAEAISRAGGLNENLRHVGFFVTAPEGKIKTPNFEKFLSKESIKKKTQRRISDYYRYHGLEPGKWYEQYLVPLLSRIDIQAISWETIIEFIREFDSVNADKIRDFYDYCLKFN